MGRAEEVLKGLASLREEKVLCDVQLKAQGQQIAGHKAVLAAASPYFRAMFGGSFKETKDQVVSMKEVSFIGLRAVIECIYTTELTALDGENIECIFVAAHLLQMNDIVEECVGWMGQNITNDCWFKFLEMADRFSSESIETLVTEFVLRNFVDVNETKDFENISKAALIKYLSSDLLKTNIKEFTAYKAAKKWILANEIPAEDIPEIIAHVRFGLVPQETIVKEILYDSLITSNKECCKLVSDAMLYHANVYSQPFYQGNLNKPRGEGYLVILPNRSRAGGFNVSGGDVAINKISFPKIKTANLRSSLEIRVAFESMSAVKIGNFMFLFGVNAHLFQNFSKRFDASTDTWLELAPVPRQAVVGAAIATHEKEIFLLGGMVVDRETDYDINGDAIIGGVYSYDISQNTWSGSRALPVKLMYAAAAELQGKIYLTGGQLTDGFSSDRVWSYDVNAKMWLTKASMNSNRVQHVLHAVEDKLYVIGGVIGSSKFIEMYDPLANQWSVLLNDAYDNSACSSFVISNKIYLVGGEEVPFHKEVHVYDIAENKLSQVNGKLPSDCSRNVSSVMILPNTRW